MQRLSKDQMTQRQLFVEVLNLRGNAIEEAWIAFEGAHERLGLAIDEYNGVLGDAVTFRDEIAQKMEDYYEERSEKWQDGDAGQAYTNWMEAWTEVELEELEQVELPDQPEMPHADLIDDLPNQPE
jgi:hypothetical protein